MLSFKNFLLETKQDHKMSRVTNTLDSGRPLGTVSFEKPSMSKSEKRTANSAMKVALMREVKKGMIAFSGTNAGRYKYASYAAPTQEKSYILRPGKHPKAKENFHRILTHIGRNFGQESVLKIKKHGSGEPAGALHYTDGTKKVDSLGHIKYNLPLVDKTGETKVKGTKFTFTMRKQTGGENGK